MLKKSEKKEERAIQAPKKPVEAKPVHSIHQKRISITTVMNNLQHPEKLKEKDLCSEVETHAQESKIEEKDRMIKELQEEILQKKLRNDMIQEAFSRRHEAQEYLSDYAQLMQILVEGCKALATSCKSFKKALFRNLLSVVKMSGKSKPKATKMVLIWVISWVTHLFAFLSSTLIKK